MVFSVDHAADEGGHPPGAGGCPAGLVDCLGTSDGAGTAGAAGFAGAGGADGVVVLAVEAGVEGDVVGAGGVPAADGVVVPPFDPAVEPPSSLQHSKGNASLALALPSRFFF